MKTNDDISAFQLDEDHYTDPDGEPLCFPESEAKNMVEDSPGDYPEGMVDFKKSTPKAIQF